MHYKIIFLLLIFLSNPLFSEELSFETLPLKKNIKENILEGEVFSESSVKTLDPIDKGIKGQSLSFSIAGLHPKSCSYALKTLSNYEEYSHFLSFVKESHYNENKKEIQFLLSHMLLPYDMLLIFNLPRITNTGNYPFSFEIGILKNLHGNIHVMEHKGRCLFYSTANWSGAHTGVNSTVFEIFSQALTKLSMEILFRISSSLKH